VNEMAQLALNGLAFGSILSITAVGLTFVYGTLRIVNFAHGDYVTFGAYAALVANVTMGLPIYVAAVLALVATVVLGVTLEYSLWRPLRRRGARLLTVLIVSIGLALVLRHLISLVFGADRRRYNVDILSTYEFAGLRVAPTNLAVIAVSVTLVTLVALGLSRTRVGQALRALADNRDLASASGIDTDRMTVYAWALGSGLAGIGGVLVGLLQTSFDPNSGFNVLLMIFAAVVLGGIGNAYGALVAGIVLGIAMELSTWSALGGGLSPIHKPIVAFSVLVTVLLVRPQGLLGQARGQA
jgi:neutral amino acid transport system permease protein